MGDRKLLVTGASGFVGQFVQSAMSSVPLVLNNRPVDLRDAIAVGQAVTFIKPQAVLHLAAQTVVPRSFADPRETYDINFLGTLNLLLALKSSGFDGRFLFVSSSDVYGIVPTDSLPICEGRSPKPLSPYAVSKVAAEALCLQWCYTQGLKVVIARPFNHIGPGQSPDFAISGFAKQIAEIKHGVRPPIIEVGDLDATRDFSDVRDVVRAYQLLLEQGRIGEIYNVSSEVESPVRSLLSKMIEMSGIDIEIRTDPSRLRGSSQRRVCGSSQKLRTEVAWKPAIPIEQTLSEVLKYWENKIGE